MMFPILSVDEARERECPDAMADAFNGTCRGCHNCAPPDPGQCRHGWRADQCPYRYNTRAPMGACAIHDAEGAGR